MGFFQQLFSGATDKYAAKWGRWCARMCVLTLSIKKNQYEGVAPSYGWLAMQVVLARNSWRQVDETTVRFEKSGQTLEISPYSSMLDAIHMIIDVEYGFQLRDLEVGHRANLLRVAHESADKYVASL